MLLTFKFKDNDVLYAGYIPELDFKLEGDEIAVYKNENLLGYFERVVGISDEEFLKLIDDHLNNRDIVEEENIEEN